MTLLIDAEHLHLRIAGRTVVKDVSIQLRDGECVGVIGPNGCGKSSLLRMLYRVVRPQSGAARWMGRNIWEMSARGFAQQVAVLTQEFAPVFDISVQETVMMGRTPHRSSWAWDGARDRQVVVECLERVGCLQLQERDFALLSGGEKQRVLLARALAQQPRCLMLDEPTNHLDVRYQHELMALVRGAGRSTLVVLHDLNIAAQYCDRLCLMHEGALVADGTPAEVLTPANIAAVYGVDAVVDAHPQTGRPRVTFCGVLG
ncbi:ABC transporter ATP-binding protein [Diaphorobacter caeni]|uniref:ABC transporter ATP-binding protein n=1 Tax=Diaphorobacter caeni TaxID=2784387 RepID=UPI00188F335C|nr:ABC transporter ATP-binding protein [Diaphorobacter caeni]MBF5002951.1 ABC transporter ATP-binding protein [Diaphorobacter caeni]